MQAAALSLGAGRALQPGDTWSMRTAEAATSLVFEAGTSTAVRTSILLSTHYAAGALNRSLPLLLGNARAPFELLIMLDQTRDESLRVIKRHYYASNLSHHLRVWQSDVPLWEARGEAWLMRHATATHYFISVQPDHLITEPGWDRALVRPFEQYDDVFAVSARCAHDAPTVGGGKGGGSKVGRCGADVFEPYAELPSQATFHVRDTCNRGPLAWHANRTRQVGYLNFGLYIMDDSDHDINCRAAKHGWVSGFYPVAFYSPEELRTRHHATSLHTPEEDRIADDEWRAREQWAAQHADEACHAGSPRVETRPIAVASSSAAVVLSAEPRRLAAASSMPLVVTAATSDAPTLRELLCMLSSLHAHGIERARVYALDDTVAGEEVGEKLRHALPSVEVTRLTDAEVPAHARIVEHRWRGHYAWKPVIIQHALTSEADGVLWVDAGESVEKASAVADLVDLAREHGGVFSPTSSGTIAHWTHPGMLSAFYNGSHGLLPGRPAGFNAGHGNCCGAVIAVAKNGSVTAAILEAWVACAWRLECIEPPGASRSNHRQDQAALSVIVEHFKASGRVPARACTTDYPRLKHEIGVAYRGCEERSDQ